MAFTIEFELDQSEQVRASRAMSYRRLSTRLAYLCLLLIPLAVTAQKAYRGSLARRGWSSETGLILIIVLALFACGLVYMAPYFSVQGMRRKNKAASGPQRYVLDDAGIDAAAPGVRSSVQWQNIVEVYENGEFLFLYVSANYALLVPKRAVVSAEMAALRQAVREWVGGRLHPVDAVSA